MAGENPTVTGVAGRYAQALFDLALEEKALEAIESDLNRFSEALDASEDLVSLVKSPVYGAEDQAKALEAILEKLKIEGLTANFIKLITKNRRLFAVPEMIENFRKLAADHRGEASAEVVSATELEEGQISTLKKALKASLDKDVQLNVRVDPSLLGGLIVKVGSRMIDSSLRTKLNSMKHAMKEVG